MNRLLVSLLAAVDALVAAAVGVAAALAPLTVLWVFGLGGGADWASLWPTSVRLWQLGQLVPLRITLPPEYLNAVGIPADAATFWLSLAPLAFTVFTAVFAARSGARAARAGAWVVGVVTGAVVMAVIAWLLWRSSGNPVAAVYGWQALLLPTAVFAVPALAGALVGAWRNGDDGLVDAVRLRAERDPRWAGVPEAAARGVGIAVGGFVGAGALIVAVATVLRGGQVIALFEASHVDVAGGALLALAQLAYLPTLIVWGGAFVAGPGFALGTGTAVSPAGTNVGVLPGVPALGIVPETATPWMLVSVLLIVAVGFVAGAAARGRLHRAGQVVDESAGPRLAAGAAIVVGGAAGAALLAAVASGSIGPGRLAEVGPAPGPVALAVGLELLVGAAIALFGPTRTAGDGRDHASYSGHAGATMGRATAADAGNGRPARPAAVLPHWVSDVSDDGDTEQFAPSDLDPLASLGGPETRGDERAGGTDDARGDAGAPDADEGEQPRD